MWNNIRPERCFSEGRKEKRNERRRKKKGRINSKKIDIEVDENRDM